MTSLVPDDQSRSVWNNLVEWLLKQHELSYVNPNLELKEESSCYRGVFASSAISKGDRLLVVPIALDGRSLEATYHGKTASPWLRCVAAYYSAKHDDQWKAYIQSLPHSYETLFAWQPEERSSYLAGTTSCRSNGWRKDDKVFKERYTKQVRPFLQHLGLLLDQPTDDKNDELDGFVECCQAISTRCFHLQQQQHHHSDNINDNYSGPYFLPLIDLLNHNHGDKKCTTLHRDQEGNFCMMAERDIQAGEEVLHSYGDDLTAAQFLQTFGFVPRETMERACRFAGGQQQPPQHRESLSPALLTKQEILHACWQVIRSNIPQTLAESMKENDMEDEVWDVAVDESRDVPMVGDNLLIDLQQKPLLNDELVTLTTAPFLPSCAYAEAKQSLLDSSILQDYYLGKLVCTALLQAIQTKLETYTAIALDTEDAALLSQLLFDSTDGTTTTTTWRKMYGLTVRIEEKLSLESLRREVVQILADLDRGEEETSNCDDSEPNKKARTAFDSD